MLLIPSGILTLFHMLAQGMQHTVRSYSVCHGGNVEESFVKKKFQKG